MTKGRGSWIVFAVTTAWMLWAGARHNFFHVVNWLPDEGRGPWDGRAFRSVWFLALGLALAWGLRRKPSWTAPALGLLLAASIGNALAGFSAATDGFAPLGRDDHPSFQYRLGVYAQSFPSPFAWEPAWNGGRLSNAVAATGAYLPGFVLVPLARLTGLGLDALYTPVVAAFFLLVCPALAYAALRIAGGGRVAGLLAALFSLCAHNELIKYLLHFGTLGWSFSVAFLLPATACLMRLVARDTRFRVWLGFALLAGASVVWPVHAALAAGWIPALILAMDWRSPRAWARAAGAALPLAAWFMPLAWGLLQLTDVGAFVKSGVLHDKEPHGWGVIAGHLWDAAAGAHPLLLVAGPAGLLLRRDRALRLSVVPLLGCGLLAMAAGPWFSQSLEWHRLGVGMAWVAALPAALLLERALVRGPETSPEADGRGVCALAGLALGLLLLGFSNVRRYYEGRSLLPFHPRKPEVAALADWLRRHTREDERVLFAGHCGHVYGGGHVAMLPALAGREMFAADYYHFSPKLVEYYMPPREYRGRAEGVFDFLRLHNIHWVVAWHKDVLKHYEGHPEWYEPAGTIDSAIPKRIFRVKHDGTLFAEGAGRARASVNRIEIEPADPGASCVIRYRWTDALAADPPAAIEPAPMDAHTTFIRVKPGGEKRVVLRRR